MAAIQQDEHWINRMSREKLPTRTKKKSKQKPTNQTNKLSFNDLDIELNTEKELPLRFFKTGIVEKDSTLVIILTTIHHIPISAKYKVGEYDKFHFLQFSY